MPPRSSLVTPPPDVMEDLTQFGTDIMKRIGGEVRRVEPIKRTVSSVNAAAEAAERKTKIYVPLVLIAVTFVALVWGTISNLAVPALTRVLPEESGPNAENIVRTRATWIIGSMFVVTFFIAFLVLRKVV